ncbi:MAG: hypothetical protein U1E48_02740 [Paracoccaceae bacterium]
MAWETREHDRRLAGYADWELAAAQARGYKDVLLPVLVRLKVDDGADPDQVFSRINGLRDRVFLEDHEADLLRTSLAAKPEEGKDLVIVLHCRPEALGNDMWTVLSVGSPVPVPEVLPEPYGGRELKVDPDIRGKDPIVAVIDDAIGFLNARFRATPATTRFDAVWLMGQGQPPAPPSPNPGAAVYSGAILDRKAIDADLASGVGEASLYHRLNEDLFRPNDHKSTNQKAGHGTVVLDLAAGAEPGAPLSTVPLLAVQLPPSAIVATSGRRLKFLVIQAMHWCVWRALTMASLGHRAPLIANLSLGTLGGPRDKTELLATWLPPVIDLYRSLSLGEPMRITAAYGNAWRDRLAARATMLPSGSLKFDWRILPDDRTANYLEIRVPKGKDKVVALTLTPPAGVPQLVLPRLPTPDEKIVYVLGGDLVAGVYFVPETNHDLILVVTAATQTDGQGAAAPPGPWTIELENQSRRNVDVLVQVERDDTPDGYRMRGRQSWLDHPQGWTWDGETMDWTMPGARCPIEREETAVSFCAIDDFSVHLIGAAMPDRAKADRFRPSLYAAEGEPSRHTGPALSALADQGRVLPGRRAAGVISGSSARLSGSSVAAPLAARALLDHVRTAGALAAYPTQADHDLELADLLGTVPGKLPRYPDSRLGKGTIPP